MRSVSHDQRKVGGQLSVTDLQPPIRTCVGCGRKQTQRAMLRIASLRGAIPVVDKGYCAPGRGAYLCRRLACAEKAFKRQAIERALKLKQSVGAPLKDDIKAEIERALAKPPVAGNPEIV